MESKKKDQKNSEQGISKSEGKSSPAALMKALKEAGYSLVRRFTRKGGSLTLYLKPAGLKGEDGNFRALETCATLGLQPTCRTHAAIPHPILILSVEMPEASQTDQSEIGNQKSEIE